ncbi:MarR family transcriptional regulator [Paenibacillus sp. SC116]|uniref:MarR family winged helix-turn-helix transcriptional regulator n=1 Tax=Paenibacillus sp. SC116 TaxID=2968986 RepID=UPI00215A7B6D|nr:MarR family transcriptional regulator [Paenibacillus sp. SC116]MCR8844607.1 MarR family transcriptional regulator [Paenibacillus sp. SC116]
MSSEKGNESRRDEVSQKLMRSFRQFQRAEWQQQTSDGQKRSDMTVLFCIQKTQLEGEKAMRVSDISQLLQVTSPTITQIINRLEESGWVERYMDPEDRRVVRVKLTSDGEQIAAEAKKRFMESFNGLLDHLGLVDSERLAELLMKVFDYYQQENAERKNCMDK